MDLIENQDISMDMILKKQNRVVQTPPVGVGLKNHSNQLHFINSSRQTMTYWLYKKAYVTE